MCFACFLNEGFGQNDKNVLNNKTQTERRIQPNATIFVEHYVSRDLLFCFFCFELYRDQDLRLTLHTVPAAQT